MIPLHCKPLAVAICEDDFAFLDNIASVGWNNQNSYNVVIEINQVFQPYNWY